ncbi:MAG: hypothetical protein LBK66_01810 [Spirochaetaceae bacterium]|nr:hypothetical protein [Spirochaetaceae bacterium]
MPESSDKTADKIYIEKLAHLVDEFQEKIRAGTKDADNFLTMSEIEHLWSELKGNTGIIYSDMLQELLSAADESDLIRKKKPNTEPKE